MFKPNQIYDIDFGHQFFGAKKDTKRNNLNTQGWPIFANKSYLLKTGRTIREEMVNCEKNIKVFNKQVERQRVGSFYAFIEMSMY